MAVYGTNIDINVIGNAVQELQKIQAEYMSLQHDQGKSIKVNADDQASQKIKKIKDETNKVPKSHNTKFTASGIESMNARMNSVNSGFEHIHKGAEGIRKSLQLMAAAGVAAFTGLGAAAVKGAQQAVDIQSSYKTTQNLIVTGGERAKAAISAVNQMQRDGRKYSLEYGVSQQKIADAYQDLIKRGHTSAEALGVMKSELQASVASGDDFSDVVRVSSNTIEEFGMKTNSTGKMLHNTKLVVNDLAYASDATATDFKSMGVAMEYVGSSAHQAGVSLRETSATIGILSNNGLEADKAGTSLQEVLQHITKIAPQGTQALKRLGLSVDDFQTKSGKLKSIPEIFSMINKGMNDAGIEGANRLKTMNQIFGTIGGNAANILASNTKQLRELEGQIKKAEQDNYVAKLAKKNSQTVKMEMARAKTSIQAVTMQLGQAFMPAIANASEALAKGLTTKRAQREINALSKEMANFGNSVAKYLVAHGHDLWDIAEALGKIGLAIGEGALKTLSTFFGILTGHPLSSAGDTTHRIATALTEIAKLTPLFKTLGGIFATYFVASKIMASAKAINELYKGMLMLSTLGGKQSLTGSLLGDLANRRAGGAMTKAVEGVAAKKSGEKAGSSFLAGLAGKISRGKGWLKGLFTPAATEALRVGDTAGGNFITRFAAKTNSSRFAQVGRSLGGRILSGIGLAIEAYDLVKDITGAFTTHNGTTRSRDIGKATGAGIGAGIGFFFGGPAGAALGGLIGRTIGGKIGPSIGKFGNGIGKVLDDVFIKHNWNKVWSDIGKGWQSFWKGMGNWWDKTIGKKGSHSGSSKESSQHEIKSLGGNHYSKTDIANIKQMNAAVKAYTNTLKTLKSVVKKNDPTKELRSMSKNLKSLNPTIKNAAKYWKNLDKPLANSSRSFKLLDKSLSGFKGKNNPLDRLESSVKSLTKTVQRYKFGKELAKQMTEADKSISGKHSFVGRFQTMTRQVESSLRSFDRAFSRDWKDTWDNIDRYPSRSLSRVSSTVNSRLNSIRSHENSFTRGFLSSWKSWTASVVSSMSSEFGKLPGIAQRAMSGIVSRLNSGISAINGVIGDFGGDKKLSTIHYANGTGIRGAHPGGLAVINDGSSQHKQELVWQPSQGWKIFSGLNRIVTLEPGAQVLPAEPSHTVLSAMNVPHYAGGTLSDDEQDKIAQEFIDNPVKASRDLVLRVTNWNSNVPIVPSFGKATAIGFSRGIANVLKDLLGIIKEPVNGDWTPVIKSAARLLHFHISAGQIGKLLRQIQTESGGKETQVQLGSSNDPDGDGSGRAVGLLQFKRSTFEADHVPGHDNIMSGFDQILAAISTLNRGGEGGWGNVGNGHGWANGGHLLQPSYGWVAEDGDEYIINPNKPNAMQLATEAMADIVSRNRNIGAIRPSFGAPQVRPAILQTSTATDSENLMVSLVKQAVEKLDNINIHPYVQVEDVAKPVNAYNAKNYLRRRR